MRILPYKGTMMKILSHELQMESHYSFSQELLSAKTSFLSMLPEENEGLESREEGLSFSPAAVEKPFAKNYDRPRTLFGIIESLIHSLHERMNSEVESMKEKAESVRSRRQLSLYERFEEKESFSFSTSGCIQTDTQKIDIDIDFSMSRSFVIENRIDIARSFDPLVINFKGEIPDLDERRFSFDLDNDGTCDQISSLKEGCGFLALDKNKDGKINEGSELFGTRLGNGFAELAEYDEDHNNWIDENDAIFDKLQIWSAQGCEEKELVGLGEVGVGAIFLGANDAEFTYKTSQNETLGKLRASSLFLFENGEVGNISQIDFDLGKERKVQNTNTPLGKLLQA